MTVQNMISPNGNNVPNQFIISDATITINGHHETGTIFQSYYSTIAFKTYDGKTFLNSKKWDYSTTTGKYRNIFLRENITETRRKIASGQYTLTTLGNI